MNKHLIVSGIILLFLVVYFSGCNDLDPLPSEEDKFVGTWKQGESYGEYNFFSDGECSISGIEGLWEIENGKLLITYFEVKLSKVYNYNFSNNDTNLTLNDVYSDLTITLTKQ